MKNSRRIGRLVLPLFMVALLSLIGCSKNEEDKKDIYIQEFEALTDIKEGRPDIYLITKALDNNYWNVITACMKKSAVEQDCNLYFSGSKTESEWKAQVTLLDKAVAAGADGIIIAPDDSSLLSEPIDKLYKQGIPVVLIDTALTKDNYDVCFMTDNLYAGNKAAEEMIVQLKKRGFGEKDSLTVGIQVGSGSSQTVAERLAGFTKYWSDNTPKSWKIADEVKVNNGDIELATTYGNDFIKNYSDLVGVFGCNNGSTVGFARAIRDNKRTDITLVGFDYSDEMAGLIADKDYSAATMLQRQDEMARLGIKAVLELLAGEKTTVKFVDTGVVVVNDETVDDEEVQSVISLN